MSSTILPRVYSKYQKSDAKERKNGNICVKHLNIIVLQGLGLSPLKGWYHTPLYRLASGELIKQTQVCCSHSGAWYIFNKTPSYRETQSSLQ